MAGNLRIEPSAEEDLPRLMDLIIPSFEEIPYSQLVGDTNTPENKKTAGQRHLHAWREHAKHFKHPVGIKCIHTDPKTSQETIISNAEWAIYDRPRTEEEYLQPIYLVSADWVEDKELQRRAKEYIKPVVNARIRWMGGRAHGVLLFMATDENFRRLGAATKCVQWGLDRCAELGCPALLEATEAGRPVYESLGFVVVERIQVEDWALPVLIWWPPGWKEVDKKEAIPGYGR